MKPSSELPKILLVDDRPENLIALEAIIDSPEVSVLKATSGNEALGLMLEHDFAVVLLDVQMPGMDGFEVAQLMRKKEKTKYIPIIFVTAICKSEDFMLRGYQVGGVDYLFKPLDPIILKGKISIFLKLNRNKLELEKSRKKIQEQNEQLKELSVRDGLTGLYNHRHFHELLNREFFLARRNRYDLSCFMIDLDYFKDVNDTFGHSFGDYVLRTFSELICGVIRKTDILARYGGEEFVLLLPNTGLEGAYTLAEKFRKKAEAFVYKDSKHSKRVTASIGISTLKTHHPTDPTDIVTFADKALYGAKAEGRNRVKVYNEEALVESGQLKKMLRQQGNLYGLQSHINKILENTREAILAGLDNLTRSPQTADEQHQQFNRHRNNRLMELLDLMGDRLGLSRPVIQTFKRAARLHDLLKIYFKDDTPLQERPLTGMEKANIYDYPFMLEQLTHMFDIFADERSVLRYHHENYDGTGYPEGLKGRELPLGARLFALVDAFVAMTSTRKYRDNMKDADVVQELAGQAGRQFDPMLVKHLLKLIADRELLEVPSQTLTQLDEEIKT